MIRPVRIFAARSALFAVGVLVTAALGCHPGVGYSTTLSATSGLQAGDPVTRSGQKIGTVESIKPASDGKSEVDFSIQGDHSDEVRKDTFAVLRTDGGNRLELRTPDANSPPAPPNSRLAGAATPAEEALLTGGSQLGSFAVSIGAAVQGFNQDIQALNQSVAAFGNSPAWSKFHDDLENLERQINQAGENAHGVVDRELPRLRGELANLTQQLEREGKTAEAQRLRDQLDRLSKSLAGGSPAATPTAKID